MAEGTSVCASSNIRFFVTDNAHKALASKNKAPAEMAQDYTSSGVTGYGVVPEVSIYPIRNRTLPGYGLLIFHNTADSAAEINQGCRYLTK